MAKRTRKKGTLKGLSFDEVSFVGQGANQNAHISIIKMADENSQDEFVHVNTSKVKDTDAIKSGKDIVSDPGESKTNTEVTEVEKGIMYYKAMAGITDEQKAIYTTLKEADQEAILKSATKDDFVDIVLFAKSIDEKKVTKKRTQPADESFEMDGQTISKSVVGEVAYQLLKSQGERMSALEKQADDANKLAKEERDARILKELSEEAVKLWPNLPGTAVEKGETLRAIRSLPENIQKAQLAMLAAGNSTSSVLFKEAGHGGQGDDQTPVQKLDRLAKEHSEKTGVDFHKAYEQVLETPVGKQLYEESLN